MDKRLEELERIYQNVDEDMRALLAPLLQHAEDWERRITEFSGKLENISLNSHTREQYMFYYRLLKEAEQQYINVMKVLMSALRKNALEEEDEFEKFMKELEQ